MSNFTFTADSITVAGKTFPAEYSVTPSGAVMVFVKTAPDAEPQRVRFPADHADHAAALAAAREAARAAETVQPVTDEQSTPTAEQNTPTAETVQQVPQDAATPASPSKDFIGTTITGHGWRILFDAETSRTRVMFDAAPTDAARAAVENAGFYFSQAMNSYNKKLTCKAHRAALALSGELNALYA